QVVRQIQYRLCTAKVLFEFYDASFGKQGRELDHVLKASAAKRVDRLSLVAYNRYDAASAGNQLNDLCLQLVGVLILIDHQILILVPKLFAQLFAGVHCVSEPDQQIVVAQQMTIALVLFEFLEQHLKVLLFVDVLRILALKDLANRDELVDRHAEDRPDCSLSRKPPLFAGQPELAAHHLNQVFSIGLIQNAERPRYSHELGVLPQS